MLCNPDVCLFALKIEFAENLAAAVKAFVAVGRKLKPEPVIAIEAVE